MLVTAIMGLLQNKELTVERGEIYLQGQNLLSLSPIAMRDLRGVKIAMIFQEPLTALNPVMTIGKQIEEVLRIHTHFTKSDRRSRTLAVMKDVELPNVEELIDAYPHQLSGGQRQRVMIAMALCLEPILLIADEPTTALDVTTQKQILSLLKRIQQRHGMGVLLITHDFGVVEEVADQVIVMQMGAMIERGSVSDILKHPKEPYTQALMRAVPTLIPPKRELSLDTKTVLQVNDLNKTHKTGGWFQKNRLVQAATHVELNIHRGETVGIVGESGSGKTTVARCILRLEKPDSGEIIIHDVDIAKLKQNALRPLRKNIQIIFQDPFKSLNPRRKIMASLIEGPINFGLSREAALVKVKQLIKIVGLSEEILSRYPHQFSGGERQRLCIVRALAIEPDVLIADEAVSALDVSTQAQILALLDDVRKNFNLALLFITHDLRVAAQICDRVIVMKGGHIVEQGPTRAVFETPQHPYTALLLASAPGKRKA